MEVKCSCCKKMMFPMMKKNEQAYKTCECCREKQRKRYAEKKEKEWDEEKKKVVEIWGDLIEIWEEEEREAEREAKKQAKKVVEKPVVKKPKKVVEKPVVKKPKKVESSDDEDDWGEDPDAWKFPRDKRTGMIVCPC